jgi:hypothetical protein
VGFFIADMVSDVASYDVGFGDADQGCQKHIFDTVRKTQNKL